MAGSKLQRTRALHEQDGARLSPRVHQLYSLTAFWAFGLVCLNSVGCVGMDVPPQLVQLRNGQMYIVTFPGEVMP
eukprot:scaffold289850_cov35-Tisochrysis_lutea.AAC.2